MSRKERKLFDDPPKPTRDPEAPQEEESDVEAYPARMKIGRVVRFDSLSHAKKALPLEVTRRLGGNAYIDGFSQPKDDVLIARIGISVSFLYADRGRPIVKHVDHPKVLSLRVAAQGKRVETQFPAYLEFAKKAEEATKTRHVALEAQLLESVHSLLVGIPTVRTTLNPIANLLADLANEQRVTISAFRRSRRQKEAQTERYLTFLSGLGFIEVREDRILPGPRLVEHVKRARGEHALDAMLADVMERGHHELQEYLRLTGLVPFLRIANSYYTPSARLEHLIRVTSGQLNKFQGYIYHKQSDPATWRGQLRQVSEAQILDYAERDDEVHGVDRVWRSFAPNAASIEA